MNATVQNFDLPTGRMSAEPAASMLEDGEYEDSYTVEQIVARIVRRINAAPLETEPCGNIYMEDMFPRSLYEVMLARLPADDVLDPIVHPDAVAPGGRVTRYLLDLTPDSLERLHGDDREFWQAMMEVFTSPLIAGALVAKYADALGQRFGADLPELVAVPIFYRDFPGYRIGIHPDAETKVATLQFYLPGDASQRHLGTSFHRGTEQGFEKLKTNAFLPNTAYSFVRTDESWHSVEELGPDEKVRNTIALTFYIKGQEFRSAPRPARTAEAKPAVVISEFYSAEMQDLCRTFARGAQRRDQVAELFSKGGTGCELGVAAGDFSERVLRYPHVGYLYSIDMWAGDRGHNVDQYRDAIARLHPYRDRNALMRMRFDEALPLFADASLDFLYVDGYAHDGELNGATFREWFPKLKRGGVIAGDDYSPEWPLVVQAVDHFCATNGLELHVIDCHEEAWNSMYPTWFAIKP